MARIRTIKPEFQQSESMGRVSRDARLLFILLWPICDDDGRTRANPRMLSSLLFPYDEDAQLKITEWLFELEREKCIRLYQVDNNAYLQIEKWQTHQRIEKPSPSRIPPPPVGERSPKRNRKVGERSPLDQGREGIKEVDQGEDLNAPAARRELVAEPSLPNWLPKEAWQAFVTMRRKIRAPLTDEAIPLALAKLEKLRASGHEPGAVLEQSVMRSWRGLFEIGTEQPRGNGRRESSLEQAHRIANELANEHAGNAGTDHGADYGAGNALPQIGYDRRRA